MLSVDMSELQVLAPKLVESPSPHHGLSRWVTLACEFPEQWKQLIKAFVARKVQLHAFKMSMGIKTQWVEGGNVEPVPCECQVCARVLLGPWGTGNAS